MAKLMKHHGEKSGKSLALSLLLHGLLLGGMFFFAEGGSSWQRPQVQPTPQPKIIEALAVTQQELQAEVSRLNQIDADKVAKQKELERQAALLKKQRQEEEQRLIQLKRQQEQAKKLADLKLKEQQQKLAKEKQELERIKQAKAKQEAALAAQAKAEQAKEAARLAKLEQEKQAEQQRLAKIAEQHRREEAKARNLEINMLVDKFGLLVKSKVTENWVVQGSDFNQACVLGVRLGVGGVVLDVKVLTSSGNQAFDRSGIAAIYKSSPLPVPDDEEAFERMRELRLTLRPEDIITSL